MSGYNEIVSKAMISIDRVFDLYEELKGMEVGGGEEERFRSILSDMRDELNRIPNLLALLGNLRAAEHLKVRSMDANYWINFILSISPINVKKSSSTLMGPAGLSELSADLESLREVLKNVRSGKP